ncbi:MAG: leucyl/phenylalanyl-tRNA--protein transferase [Acidimicrobiia bacterium]|nr:leucyl/phenylalanyl-tRNA--protein transferase [Acidimicrobiia bacterium]
MASDQPNAHPVEPPPTRWQLPDPTEADDDVVGLGADLEPGTILAAYRSGLFPMRVQRAGPIGWWSPDPRGVIPLDGLQVSRSLRRSCRRFEIRVDTEFDGVIRGCADPARPSGWIDDEFIGAYTRLHELGWVHSVEVWTRDAEPELVGGVYGVAIGGLFAGESMFHRRTDASKAALVALVERLRAGGATLFDVQWITDHLASLGAREISRGQYLDQLADALARPQLVLE